jgi:hypothetical protein
MLLSYFIGQKNYPIKYNLKTIGLYTGLAGILYAASCWIPVHITWLHIGMNTVLLGVYLGVLIKRDLSLKDLPYINRFISGKK